MRSAALYHIAQIAIDRRLVEWGIIIKFANTDGDGLGNWRSS